MAGRRSDSALGDAQIGHALEAGGYSAGVARAVVRVGGALRSRSRTTGREYAAVVDTDTGAQWGAIVSGQYDTVVIRDLLRGMPPGQPLLALHTHPFNTSLSLRDVGVLVASPNLRSVAAVGEDGHWFVMTKREDSPHADELDLRLLFDRARTELEPAYTAFVVTGRYTLDQANRRLLHAIWRLLAPHLGLRYDWTDPSLGLKGST